MRNPERHGPFGDALPSREPADHQVAAGAVAGLAAGAAMWLVAMLAAKGDMGFTFPLRLVAATFLGHAALDSGFFAPVLLGLALVALASVLFGLVYVSILPESADTVQAVLAGMLYAGVVWLVTWYGLVRVTDPILFIAGRALHMLALYEIYGFVLGFFVPFLRKVLP